MNNENQLNIMENILNEVGLNFSRQNFNKPTDSQFRALKHGVSRPTLLDLHLSEVHHF